MIKEQGLKPVQIIWEREKAKLEEQFRSFLPDLERTDPNIVKMIKKSKDEVIEVIESDLYPDRKKNKGSLGWIWVFSRWNYLFIH